MGIDINTHIDYVSKSAGAALLCSIFAQRLADRQSEIQLMSETLAWIMLPILHKAATAAKKGQTHPDLIISLSASPPKKQHSPVSNLSLWVVALSLAVYCCFAAENGLFAFVPWVKPLLLLAQKYLIWPDADRSTPASSPKHLSHFFICLANTVWGSVLAASFAVLALKPDWGFRASDAISLVPVAALLVAYVALDPRLRISRRACWLPSPLDIQDVIVPLSLRVVAVLVVAISLEMLAYGLPACTAVPETLTLGLAKAMSWYFAIQITRHSTWRAAAATLTYGLLSARNPFAQSRGSRAFLHVLASFLTPGQIIHILPKQAKARAALWTVLLVSNAPYLINMLEIQYAQSSSPIHPQKHPVQILVQNAKEEFQRLLERQSKSYAEAHNEYRRRYGLEPPPGFETWFNFTNAHRSPIIDEFDMIYESIAPFLRLSGQEVLEIVNRVQDIQVDGNELWYCKLSGRDARTVCSHPIRTFDRHIQLSFDTLLRGLQGILPDISFLVNHIDEPRVLIPPQEGIAILTMMDISRNPVWDSVTKFCSWERSATLNRTRPTAEDLGLPFVQDPVSEMDLCQHPEHNATHGLAISPMSFRLVEGQIPVLSTGTLSTMSDILYPSPAYLEDEFQYMSTYDVEWDRKQNNLYWAGSTTGGFAAGPQWRSYHRQRFVELAQGLRRQQHYYLRETSDGVLRRVGSYLFDTSLFNVAFTRVFQCESRYCRDQRVYFGVRPWEDRGRALGSRLVFDTDGNGISGRYYSLLASRSAPLKQTLMREWHDERLVPWLHYFPVSQSMGELPELVLHLTSTDAGGEAARYVAEQGRDWSTKALREVDRTIYVYRLLLELGRLQDPNRPRMVLDDGQS